VPAGAGQLGALVEPGNRCSDASHGSLYKGWPAAGWTTTRCATCCGTPAAGWPLVFAVDAPPGLAGRRDQPGAGFYYPPPPTPAGQPIVAGWSYQWVTQLDWANDSWTAPDGRPRIPPTATREGHRPTRSGSWSAGSATPRSPGVRLRRRLRPDRADPRTGRPWPPGLVVRHPRRPGLLHPTPTPRRPAPRSTPQARPPIKLTDPGSWPTPDVHTISTDDRYGTVQVSAWHGLHPKLGRRGHWIDHDQPPIVPAP